MARLAVLVLLCLPAIVFSYYTRVITQKFAPIVVSRSCTGCTHSAPVILRSVRKPIYRNKKYLVKTHSSYTSVPVVGVSSPTVLSYYSSSPLRAAVRSTTTARAIPQNLINIYSKRECPTGSCQYFHACGNRMQPSKFCSLSNGFTGICCNSGLASPTPVNTQGQSSSSNRNNRPKTFHNSGFFASNTQTITNNQGQTITFGTSGFVPGPGSSPPQSPALVSTKVVSQPAHSTSSNKVFQANDIHVDNNEIKQIVNKLNALEDELSRNHIVPQKNSLGFSHQNFFGTNQLALKEMQNAFQVLQMLIQFAKHQRTSVQELINSQIDIRKTDFASFCPANPTCSNSKYRTVDGTCNNLINTAQGKAVSAFTRLLPSQYADEINEPRVAGDGSPLPNPRLLSISLSNDNAAENPGYSLMLMSFGQFVDHDISRTATTKTHNNEDITCCDAQILRNPRLRHPSCFIMTVPNSDSFLRSESQSCINFVRSAPALNSRCNLGPREQLNQLSSYIDGNNVYGASKEEASKLRIFRGGFMKTSRINKQPFLPLHTNHTTCRITQPSPSKRCFEGGDTRANENIDLVVLHTVFLREHNKIAATLAKLNPSWDDEKLYQETRRIIIAQMQHITYSELLPLLLGERALKHFGLGLSTGYSNTYNPIVDASILNEFATAGYRLHTLIQGIVNMNTEDNKVVYQVHLRDLLNNPELLYEKNGYEMRLAGLVGQPIHAFDTFFSREITNHLFQGRGKRFGLDLVALNIQRGRDHGLPGYIKYREICGLSQVNSFDDLYRVFSNPGVVDVLRQTYNTVEDIDLFVGGSSEKPLNSGVVGPTFACIIGEQFRRIREGDRFWYENPDQEGSFTPAQLAEIKKSTLSNLLCRNSQLSIMQPNAFLTPTSTNNPKVSCDQLEQIDLRHWTNEQ